MLIPLILLGVALIAFGAFVLLRYADRPGGTIKWLGAEITSKGAGLPLIALGVVFIAFAAVRFSPTGQTRLVNDGARKASSIDSLRSADGGCIDGTLTGIPRDRTQNVEVGMRDLEIIGSHQPLDQPFALVLTENGKRIGALRLRLYRGSNSSADLYKIEGAFDASCAPLTDLRNSSRGGNPHELVNWDTLRLTLGGNSYDLRIGGDGDITVGHFTRVQP